MIKIINKVFKIIIIIMIGLLILVGLFKAIYVNQNWLWFTTFIGINLIESGVTKWCLLEIVLSKLGLQD
jgi:hypothetical protein